MITTFRLMLFVPILAILLALPAPAQVKKPEAYSAMVMDVRGPAPEFHEGVLRGLKIQALDFLNTGDVVGVPAGAALVLNYFASETREEIPGPAVVKIGVQGAEILKGEASAVKRERVDYMPKKAQLDAANAQNFGNVAVRGLVKDSGLKLTALLNTAVRPGKDQTLSWKAFPGASGYGVRILDAAKNPVFKAQTAELKLTIPAAKLTSGATYTVLVEATAGKKALSQAQGRVEVLASAQEVERLESRLKTRCKSFEASGECLAQWALILRGAGLFDEEAQALLKMKGLSPGDATMKRLGDLNPNLF